jgi:hypothetical protein
MSRDRRPFYALLLIATLLPYTLLASTTGLVQGSPGFDRFAQLLLFLGAAGHVGASFFFYGDADVRHFMRDKRARYLGLPIAIVVGAAVFFATAGPEGRAFALVLFWIWQVHHFTRQNHGILAFVSRADGIAVRRSERLAITLSDLAAIPATLVFVAPYGRTPLADHAWTLHTGALLVFACAWVVYLVSLRPGQLRAAPLRGLVMLTLMLFYLPLFVFEDALSAVFVYLVAHGLQYLVFMGFVVRRPDARRLRNGLLLVACTLVVGASIDLTRLPGRFGALGPALIGVSYGIVVWHFLLDAGVWRLSESFQRRYMADRFDFLGSR